MKKILIILILLNSLNVCSQETLTLDKALHSYIYQTIAVKTAFLKYENARMEYENYQKKFLPSFELTVSPLAFNRSMRLLQNPQNGDYQNVEDYSNTSFAGLSVVQQIGPLGGTLTAYSSLSFLREFSRSSNSFSSMPFSVSYTQPLVGSYKRYKYEHELKRLEFEAAERELCSAFTKEQQKILKQYMDAYSCMLREESGQRNILISDTLLAFAKQRYQFGYITEYEYRQVEIQQLEQRISLDQARHEYEQAISALCTELNIQKTSIKEPPISSLPLSITKEEVMERVHQNNPILRSIHLKEEQARLSLFEARLSTRFNASLSVSYGLNQYAPTFHEAYRRPNQRQAISLTFSIPVFQWGINRNIRHIAENNYQTAIMELEKEQNAIENEISQIYYKFIFSSSTHGMSCRYYEMSKKHYNLAIEMFKHGKVSLYEVFTAYQNQQESMQRLLESVQSMYASYYAIQEMTLYDYGTRKNISEIIHDDGEKKREVF